MLRMFAYLTPSPMPHANPNDLPPSTVAGHGLDMPVLLIAAAVLVLALIVVHELLALRRST